MAKKLFLISLIFCFFVALPTVSKAGDIDEFKTIYGEWLDNWNKMEADKIFDKVHENVVAFGPTNPLPFEGKDGYKSVINGFFENIEIFNVTPVNISYRVLGDTAIVAGICGITIKPKEGPVDYNYERFIEVWVKKNGNWKYIASQEDVISIGN